jgi:hypothetical protein
MPTIFASLYVRLLSVAALVAALLLGWHFLTSHYDSQGYERAKAEDKQASDEQAERNRELQRQAERNYVVKREAQDHFIVTTIKEIEHAAAPLATCPLPPDLVRLLNDANHCASGDSPASCGAADEVPKP